MSGGGSSSAILSPGKDLVEGAGQTAPLNAKGNFQERPHLIETARELRHFVRGKPQSVRDAAHNIIAGFRSVAAGRAEPDTYRMIGENVERLGAK
jgi:hypothetical protein